MLNYLLVMIQNFTTDEEGATAIEYGLIAAVLAIVLIVAFNLLGGEISDLFGGIFDGVGGGGGGGG